MNKFDFLRAYTSPFRRPRLKWYVGKIAVGTPYFFPRRLVKPTPEMAMEAAMKKCADDEAWNERNAKSGYTRTIRPLDEVYEDMLKSWFTVPRRFGFDVVGLGWKTKWSDKDFRFEYSPLISFVAWRWQIAVKFIPPQQDHYWEAWLYYDKVTKGTTKERAEQLQREFGLTFTVYRDGEKSVVDYYPQVLRSKYLLKESKDLVTRDAYGNPIF